MTPALTDLLPLLSDSMAGHVATAAKRLAAIRLSNGRHICATLWSSDLVVTCGDLLPEREQYVVLIEGRQMVGRMLWRDEVTSLSGLRLDTPHALPDMAAPPEAQDVGPETLLIAIGVDNTGAAVAGLAVLQHSRPESGPGGSFPGIDRDSGPNDIGGPVIAPGGALVGIIARGGAWRGGIGSTRVIPYAEIAKLAASHQGRTGSGAILAPQATHRPDTPRGWLGVELQPATVPLRFRNLTGQGSGRRVTAIFPNGPACRAGMLAGDIVLTIAERSMTGSGTVRDFLSPDRIGSKVEIVLLRGDDLISLDVTVGGHPLN